VLPVGFLSHGTLGCIVVIATSDTFRYIPILIGQRREGPSFGMQDAVVTLVMIGLGISIEWIRWRLGFGTAFED
jgi:hypothetical protein